VKRWSINLICGLSLLIFLLAMGIWVRSYFVADSLDYSTMRAPPPAPRHVHNYRAKCSLGVIVWVWDSVPFMSNEGWHYHKDPPEAIGYWPSKGAADPVNIHFVGLGCYVRSDPDPELTAFILLVRTPLWLFLLFAIPPALWVRRWRQKRGRGFPVEVVETTA